jgi:light-regulated signal transduction histidine kinase (bacteriophytochrome)
VQARIEVGSRQDARDGKVFFVRDNGAGFDMAYASKMFEAFHRMHTAAQFEGTAIDVAIVHKIVARHQRRIRVEAGAAARRVLLLHARFARKRR